MAKELPYFKFEPNQWENGNIQMCSNEDKGLFIELCCMYWSRLGDVPLKLAVNKLCAGNATALDSLINENIFTVIDGLICIDFLNEQLGEFDNTSKKNSKNAKDGWAKRRLSKYESERNATALDSQSQSDAIREDKIREDKIKEDIKITKEKTNRFIPPTYEMVLSYCSERKNSIEANSFIDYYTSNGWVVGKGKMKDWKSAIRTWENRSINKNVFTESKITVARPIGTTKSMFL